MATTALSMYRIIGACGFGFTLVSNLPPMYRVNDKLKQSVPILGSVLLMKCCINGLLWPTIPFQIVKDLNGFVSVGVGIERLIMTFITGSIPCRKWRPPFN